jgi:hypothetical protein
MQGLVTTAKGSQLPIMGDFNFPEIDNNHYLVDGGQDSTASKFFDSMQQVFLPQHIPQKTRY